MWCDKCHYGSEGVTLVTVRKHKANYLHCPQCGYDGPAATKKPFPDKPVAHGSGKPNGKTAKRRK